MRTRKQNNFSKRLADKWQKEDEEFAEKELNECMKKREITSCNECLHKCTCTRRE